MRQSNNIRFEVGPFGAAVRLLDSFVKSKGVHWGLCDEQLLEGLVRQEFFSEQHCISYSSTVEVFGEANSSLIFRDSNFVSSKSQSSIIASTIERHEVIPDLTSVAWVDSCVAVKSFESLLRDSPVIPSSYRALLKFVQKLREFFISNFLSFFNRDVFLFPVICVPASVAVSTTILEQHQMVLCLVSSILNTSRTAGVPYDCAHSIYYP